MSGDRPARIYKDVKSNLFVIPGSNYHMRNYATARLKSMFDNATWFNIAVPEVPVDPLKFRDERRYMTGSRTHARQRTELNDAVKLGYGKLDGLATVIAVQDFDFMGGSLGMAAGEAVSKGLDTAVEKGCPRLACCSRRFRRRPHAGRHSVADADAAHHHRGAAAAQGRKPYIVVLTNPTTGGVTASYAMLGDVQIAEPGALIGFAGPASSSRPSARNCRRDSGAEYLRDHGMVDMVVHRHELRPTIARLCRLFTKAPTGASPLETSPASEGGD